MTHERSNRIRMQGLFVWSCRWFILSCTALSTKIAVRKLGITKTRKILSSHFIPIRIYCESRLAPVPLCKTVNILYKSNVLTLKVNKTISIFHIVVTIRKGPSAPLKSTKRSMCECGVIFFINFSSQLLLKIL